LGYDVVNRKLVVNEPEAQRVREIFELYASKRSLLAVVQELDSRSWANKIWTTRKGTRRGGKQLIKTSLHKLLTNATFTGKVRHKGELFAGEHPGIISADLFDRVQTILHEGNSNGSRTSSGAQPVLLRGLTRCAACQQALESMTGAADWGLGLESWPALAASPEQAAGERGSNPRSFTASPLPRSNVR
jgi:site-specific DNA recombinase